VIRFGGEGQTDRAKGGPNPFAAFGNGFVWQTDNHEFRLIAARHVDLHIYWLGINAFKRKCCYLGEHYCSFASGYMYQKQGNK
jgi:hypothetical protein